MASRRWQPERIFRACPAPRVPRPPVALCGAVPEKIEPDPARPRRPWRSPLPWHAELSCALVVLLWLCLSARQTVTSRPMHMAHVAQKCPFEVCSLVAYRYPLGRSRRCAQCLLGMDRSPSPHPRIEVVPARLGAHKRVSTLSLLDPHVSWRGLRDLPLPPCTAFALCQSRLLRPDASRLSHASSSGACVGYGERACRVLQPLARDPGILIFGPPQPVLSSSGRPAPTCKLMQRL